MRPAARKNLNNPHNLTVSDGGKTLRGEPKTDADYLEGKVRELLFAMRRKNGTSVSQNFRNAARKDGTRPLRMLIRRLKEAKAARNDAHNYPLAKLTVREIDAFVDRLYHKQDENQITGEFPPPAAPARRTA